MACPDRYRDQRIIAEVERRKAARQTPVASDDIQVIEVTGELQNILLTDIPEQDIVKIQKSTYGWEVYVKTMKS